MFHFAANLDKFGQIRTNSDKFGQIRTKSDKVGHSRTKSDKVGQIWTNSDKFGQIRTNSDKFHARPPTFSGGGKGETQIALAFVRHPMVVAGNNNQL
jgi:hypothetical protein